MGMYNSTYEVIKAISVEKMIHNYYYKKLPPGWKMQKFHSHNALEFICCLEGVFEVSSPQSKKPVQVKASECVIIKQGVDHCISVRDTQAVCACLQLNKDYLKINAIESNKDFDITADASYGENNCIKIFDDNTIAQSIIQIANEANQKRSDWEEVVRFYIVNFFIALYRNIENQINLLSDKTNRHVLTAMSYIYENLCSPITPGDVANHVHVTVNHLMHLFKIHTGKGIMETVMELRAQRGKSLIENTGLSISEIATQCGYSSIHHFSIRLKKFLGKSPSEYRKDVSGIDLLEIK